MQLQQLQRELRARRVDGGGLGHDNPALDEEEEAEE